MSKRPRDGRAADPASSKPRPTKGDPPPPDDIALWHHTTRSVTRLRKAKARVPEVGALPEPQAKVRPPPIKALTPAKTPAFAAPPRHPPKTALTPPKTVLPKAPPPLVPIERRKARRIARGIVEIDARIDLHGLRQVDAERRLRSFLLDARSHGLRTVLVITGKGGERGADERHGTMERSARGVLRRSVPLWLEQPDLRDCVAGIAPAHVRHGGEGALYIHLRKPRGRG